MSEAEKYRTGYAGTGNIRTGYVRTALKLITGDDIFYIDGFGLIFEYFFSICIFPYIRPTAS